MYGGSEREGRPCIRLGEDRVRETALLLSLGVRERARREGRRERVGPGLMAGDPKVALVRCLCAQDTARLCVVWKWKPPAEL